MEMILRFLDIVFWDERSPEQIFILLFWFGNMKTKTKTHIVVEKKERKLRINTSGFGLLQIRCQDG